MEPMSAASFGIPSLTTTRLSESGNGSGRKSTALTTEKMDVLARGKADVADDGVRDVGHDSPPAVRCPATYVAAACTFDGGNDRKVQRQIDDDDAAAISYHFFSSTPRNSSQPMVTAQPINAKIASGRKS